MQNKGYPADWLYQLKQKNDIVSVVGKYLHLEKKGGKYWACCPFHNEKTPSFSVNEPGQYYHCLGCGKGGDVIKFICEVEDLNFIESIKFLADLYKIPMPETNNYDESSSKQQKDKKKHNMRKIFLQIAL